MLDVLIRGEVEIETVVMHLFQVHVILDKRNIRT